MYNPFKAHIIRFGNGKFGVRRATIVPWLIWEYLSSSNHVPYHWWYTEDGIRTCAQFDTKEAAEAALVKYVEHKKKVKSVRV